MAIGQHLVGEGSVPPSFNAEHFWLGYRDWRVVVLVFGRHPLERQHFGVAVIEKTIHRDSQSKGTLL